MASASVMSDLPALLAEIGHALLTGVRDVYRDFTEISFRGAQASLASKTALAVVIATGVACAMHLPEVWWASISAIMCSQATRPASVRKGILRLIGTVAGAALSLVLVGWIAYDHAACSLILLIVATVGVLGVIVSPHGYAWLLGAITFVLVVLMSLADPLNAFDYACYRVIEVCVGTLTAMAVAIALAPPGGGDSGPVAPGWTDLLGERWPAVLHALRGGIAVALIPDMWDWLEVSDITPIAVTIAAVMAAPVLADHPLDDGRQIVQKALHRLIGCLVGGIPGLLLLGLSLELAGALARRALRRHMAVCVAGREPARRGLCRQPGVAGVRDDAGAGRRAAGEHHARHQPADRHRARHDDPVRRLPRRAARAAGAGRRAAALIGRVRAAVGTSVHAGADLSSFA